MVRLLEPETAGNPTGKGPKWCRRSTYWLSQELARRGMRICPNSVAKMLTFADYSLRCCRKSISRTNHPDRDRQFQRLEDLRRRFGRLGLPIISVDTKKRELVGNFSNKGRTYRRDPYNTNVHDFRSDALGVAIPYGIFDVTQKTGTVVVGATHDTPQFAVDCIQTWLVTSGFQTYGQFRELLILADSGGSNGARPRLWEYALHEARAALERLAREAEEKHRSQQQQQGLEAFQQWLKSPAGKQAREKLDTRDMPEQEILQSLFQHFVGEQK